MITKAEINFLRTLSQSRSARQSAGLFVAQGAKLITDLESSGVVLDRMFRVGEDLSASQMERISSLKTPASEVALFRMPLFTQPSSPLVLALDSVQDPGNMGTIIRTADWFGINTIYCSPDSADVFAPKVVQATMGSVARVRVVYTDLVELIECYDGAVLGTFLERADNIYSVSLPTKGIIVMGSEGHGISPAIEELVSQRLNIPRIGGGESLNVAIAAAVIISRLASQK